MQKIHIKTKLKENQKNENKSGKGNKEEDEKELVIQRNYKMLACDLTLLPKNSDVWALINEYMRTPQQAAMSGSKAPQILRIFVVDRHGEEARYGKHAQNTNRMLLWHGESFASWASILSQGLRIAQPAAPDAGFNFGKGLYFLDIAEKAAGRCNLGASCKRGFMLLAEVALGTCRELVKAEPGADPSKLLPKSLKCHSVFGRGSMAPDLARASSLSDGVRVPLGPLVKREIPGGSLPHNEYVVYDAKRVRMRYLVEFSSIEGSETVTTDGATP